MKTFATLLAVLGAFTALAAGLEINPRSCTTKADALKQAQNAGCKNASAKCNSYGCQCVWGCFSPIGGGRLTLWTNRCGTKTVQYGSDLQAMC
ncbi:uncharacterized protein UV8b_03840 [Ustilaginoidea virens]|uniref:Uncharacterized protein n=1 Tax=Ustilaginoidea virens TaxID=1159556 RepID=A0A8E5HQC4_USTVR|nr:uncharacterized protein UV8b_03840 [Ustilaginoidea virens]QUC19599.1 hypothetical protein UV8b_03840 [Ustilaginoidea virens]